MPPPPPPPPPPSSLSCPPGCVLSSKCGEKKNWGTIVAAKAERPEVRGRTVAVNRVGPQLNMDEILNKKLKKTGRVLAEPVLAEPVEEEFGFGDEEVGGSRKRRRQSSKRKTSKRKSSTRKHKRRTRKHKKRTHKKRRV